MQSSMAELTPSRIVSNYKIWSTLALVLCSAALAFILGTIIWGMNRGFDLCDEGFALLAAQKPSAYPFHSSFHYFLALCPNLLYSTIFSLRLWHLLSRLCAPIVLAIGFLKWFNQNNDQDLLLTVLDKSLLIVMTTIGSLIGYAVMVPQTLSYSSLSSFFLLCAVGCFSFGLSTDPQRLSFKTAFFVTGFFTSLAFFVKFTAALAMLLVFVIAIVTIRKNVRWTLAWLGVGLVLGASFFFAALQNPITWYSTFVGELGADLRSSHGPTYVFAESIKSLFKHLSEVSAAAVAFVIVFVLAKRTSIKFVSDHFPATMLITTVAVTAVFGWCNYGPTEVVHRSVLYFSLLPVLCFCAMQLRIAGIRTNSTGLWVLAALPVLPVIMSIGTDAPLFLGALSSAAPLYLFVGTAYYVIAKKFSNMLFFYVGQALFCVLSVVVFWGGYVTCPRDTESLTLQTEKLSDHDSPLAGLMVEPRIKTYIENTKQILEKNGFRKGDYILGLYDVPGLVYAVSGRSIGAAWYFGEPICAEENRHHLSTIDMTGIDRLFLIVTNPENKPLPPDAVMAQLRARGLPDFELVGRTLHPYVYHSIYCKSFIYAPSRLIHQKERI